MNTLDKDIEITVSGFNVATSGNYVYKIQKSGANTATFEDIFVGNCYLQSGATSKTFYINDIINTCRDGFANAFKDSFTMRDIAIYDIIRIQLIVGANTYSNTKNVYFAYDYPNIKSALQRNLGFRNNMYDGQGHTVLAYNLLQGSLLPHLPYVRTTQFNYLMAVQWNTVQQAVDAFRYNFSGGVEKIGYMSVTRPTNKQPELYKISLNDLFSYTSGNGTDGLLSVGYLDNYVEITNNCDITLRQPESPREAWIYDERIDSYLIAQPLAVELFDTDESEGFGYLTNEQLYRTTQFEYTSAPITIDFDAADAPEGVMINGEATSAYGSIVIKSPSKFTGRKTIQVKFDWVYDDDSMRLNGVLSNLRIYIKSGSGVANVFDCAVLDACPANYYLMWQDRYGGFQCQRFEKTETYSESFEYKSIENYKNEKNHSGIVVTPKWKLNSGFIDGDYYPYYESIFTSRDLMLYDTREDKSYIVNVTDSSYTEKTFKNQSRKMFNLQINLEANKKQNIQY